MKFAEVVPPHREPLKGLQKLILKVLMSVDWKGTTPKFNIQTR